jgi:hypothetical protein
VYCANNPFKYIDPDGRKIKVVGDAASKVTSQINQATSLRVQNLNGRIYTSGIPITKSDVTLFRAFHNPKVVVGIDATNSNYTKEGNWFVGGAYGGSEIGEDGKVYTKQTINPTMTKTIDDFYDLGDGITALHEVLESYEGGVDSPGVGTTTFGNEDSPEFKDIRKLTIRRW